MKLDQLQEAQYSGQRSLEKMMQFFFRDDELTDGDEGESIFFPSGNYIVRNEKAHGECNEVWWVKFDTKVPNKVGIMYVDEMVDWIPEQEFVQNFIIYKQDKVF